MFGKFGEYSRNVRQSEAAFFFAGLIFPALFSLFQGWVRLRPDEITVRIGNGENGKLERISLTSSR